ncbi:MAG: hypothetical protein ACJ716_05930 [Marmoricola sp.]
MSDTVTVHDEVLSLVSCVVGAVLFAGIHWQFRTGWQMQTGKLAPRDAVRPTVIRLGYTALPGLIGCTAGAVLFAVSLTFGEGNPNPAQGLAVLISALVAGAGAVWLVKEFYAPTERRTPVWLSDERQGRRKR